MPEAKNGTNLALGGGQGGAFAATFDGVSVNTNRQGNTTETSYLTPSLEAITEFAVDTNGFKAEYGQAGGGVISFASKSGTNEVHGSAYDFIRNDYVDARGFFAPTKGVYRQNDFGGSLGGPVWIPKVYNGRNRTFFFVAYEGFRNRQGSPGQISSVPTPEMYQGDFSNWVNSKNQLIPIYDTATTRANPSGSGSIRDPFPGNIIPVQTVQRGLQPVHRAGEIRAGAQSPRNRAGNHRVCQPELYLGRRQFGGIDHQGEREDRPCDQQQAPAVLPVQPGQRPGAARGRPVRRACRFRSTAFRNRPSPRTYTG